MTRDEQLPVSLHDALVELTSELRIAGPDALSVVSAAWPELVGRELARMAAGSRSGPHAENMLRDRGTVAAGPV